MGFALRILFIPVQKRTLATFSIPVCRAVAITVPGLKYVKSDKFVALCTPKRPMGEKSRREGESEGARRGGDANICVHLRKSVDSNSRQH